LAASIGAEGACSKNERLWNVCRKSYLRTKLAVTSGATRKVEDWEIDD
jgi:hypothetical protein